jgi:hypothetical protein
MVMTTVVAGSKSDNAVWSALDSDDDSIFSFRCRNFFLGFWCEDCNNDEDEECVPSFNDDDNDNDLPPTPPATPPPTPPVPRCTADLNGVVTILSTPPAVDCNVDAMVLVLLLMEVDFFIPPPPPPPPPLASGVDGIDSICFDDEGDDTSDVGST